jgi:hypothetical protein
MKIEISGLIKQRTWKTIECSPSHNVIKSPWAKARFCVRGDLQEEGVDYFETYAPVVAWSTVRMLLTVVL